MSELPTGWAGTTLGEVTEVVSGSTPSTANASYWDGDIPWITPDDLSRDRSKRISRGARLITRAGYESCSTRLVPTGTVLYTSRAPIGYVAIAANPVCTNQGFKSFVPSDALTSDYLYWFLRHATPAIQRLGSGTTFPELSKARARDIPVPIPPLAEQQRIVAAIEEDISRLETACGSLTRVQRLLERWRFATLAVLARHRAPQRRIGDVARVGSGATPKRDRLEYWAGGDVPWVTSGQLTRPFVTEPAALITQKALLETSCRVWPKGTLLVALYGEGKTRGHCSELLIDAATNQACAAIQIHDPDVDRAFLKLYFNAMYQANRSLSAGGVQPNLSLGLIKDMTFPCPPVAEQRAIVDRIVEELARADHLGLAVAEALAGSAGLRRSILARAFRGELVQQDFNDEPANLLLDRISAARAARLAPGRKRRVRAPA